MYITKEFQTISTKLKGLKQERNSQQQNRTRCIYIIEDCDIPPSANGRRADGKAGTM